MSRKALDALDRQLLGLLTHDGRMSAGKLAASLRITPPTVRSRLEALMRSGILRIAALLNFSATNHIDIAIVGISLATHAQLGRKLEQISNLEKVHWVAVVTGHYDLIVEVVLEDGMSGLYRFLTEELPRVGGIRSSESFMVMKARRKWILLPQYDR